MYVNYRPRPIYCPIVSKTPQLIVTEPGEIIVAHQRTSPAKLRTLLEIIHEGNRSADEALQSHV